MIADASMVPSLDKKMAYRIRGLEAAAVADDATGEWSEEIAEQTDRHILSALNALYDSKDVKRVETARKHLIAAHLNLVVSARRERVRAAQ